MEKCCFCCIYNKYIEEYKKSQKSNNNISNITKDDIIKAFIKAEDTYRGRIATFSDIAFIVVKELIHE